METFAIKNLSFSYPKQDLSLNEINLTVSSGDFIVLSGYSGSGKTTLLKHLKPTLTPHGKQSGEILFLNEPISRLSAYEEAAQVAFLMQNPQTQLVNEKVWQELAFGLENLNVEPQVIRLRVAEVASYFNLESIFYEDVAHLSGGQKQKVNLAALMALRPSVLVLDEPTSQLDPIATSDFYATLVKINRELGTTIILSTHQLEDVLDVADRLVILDEGKVIYDDTPYRVSKALIKQEHNMLHSLPIASRAFGAIDQSLSFPITISEGKKWLSELIKIKPTSLLSKRNSTHSNQTIVSLKHVWFRYDKRSPDVLKDLSLNLKANQINCIVGGNGCGKSTLLALIANIHQPYEGILNNSSQSVAYLPQDPQSLFIKNTLEEDFDAFLKQTSLSSDEKKARFDEVIKVCQLEPLLHKHPFDLSGGELQAAAMGKLLLLDADLYVLDEPTKGMDAAFKLQMTSLLLDLKEQGKTIVLVSHDLEFIAEVGDFFAMLFDGNVISQEDSNLFFKQNNFYTTPLHRMSQIFFEDVIILDDLLSIFKIEKKKFEPPSRFSNKKENEITEVKDDPQNKKRGLGLSLIIILLVMLTIVLGFTFFDKKGYLWISWLVLAEIMLPFLFVFENRKPNLRELMVIAVLAALAVSGRTAFFMIPQFKPVAAIVIIAGVSLGAQSGFLVGALSMLVSNMLVGQGPWTPWQMLAMGLIGFFAGVLFKRQSLYTNRFLLSLYGFSSVLIIYGGIVNPASLFMFQPNLSFAMIIASYVSGLTFDLIHAGSTVFFLMLFQSFMLEKLDRLKRKYGLML